MTHKRDRKNKICRATVLHFLRKNLVCFFFLAVPPLPSFSCCWSSPFFLLFTATISLFMYIYIYESFSSYASQREALRNFPKTNSLAHAQGKGTLPAQSLFLRKKGFPKPTCYSTHNSLLFFFFPFSLFNYRHNQHKPTT